MGYAAADGFTGVKRLLNLSGAMQDDRLTEIDNAISALFDRAVGRSFGTGFPADETVEVDVFGRWKHLLLPRPLVTVTSIETGGTWDGTAWTGGTVMPVADYRLIYRSSDGAAFGIVAIYAWSGVVRVTGQWADADTVTVPPEVKYAVDYTVARQYKVETSQPSGFIGPEGFAIPVTEAIKKNEVWQTVVSAYQVSVEVVI